MPAIAANTTTTIIPSLRHRTRSPPSTGCATFGFEKQAVYAHGETVHHAQLTFGNGMIMLGSVSNDDAWGKRIAQPDEIGGRETQRSCLIVADADAQYARAKAAGAVIVDELETKDYNGKGYSCRDPEGHLWWFGTYHAWKRSE